MARVFRILIVEDEPLIALDLGETVSAIVKAEVIVKASVEAAREVLHEPLHLALLDVDVVDGKTFELARSLEGRQIPFAFVTGSPKAAIPEDLRGAPSSRSPFSATSLRLSYDSPRGLNLS